MPQNLPTIVLPLDGSELADRATALAAAIATRIPARLVLVTAPEVYGLDMAWYSGAASESVVPMVPITELMESAREASATYVESRRDALAVQGIDVATAVVDDLPARAILQTAEAEGAWLIVMATHGQGGLSRWALGSVADKVLQAATAPVLLVRSGAPHVDPEFEQILVPLDGSPLAEAVLPPVIEMAKAFGSAVTLAFVSQEARLGIETAAMLEAQQHEVERMQTYLQAQVDRLKAEGVAVEGEVLVGERPADVLLDRAGRGDIDLVALTTHGRGGLSRWTFGSVADRLVRLAATPVLVVRNKE